MKQDYYILLGNTIEFDELLGASTGGTFVRVLCKGFLKKIKLFVIFIFVNFSLIIFLKVIYFLEGRPGLLLSTGAT